MPTPKELAIAQTREKTNLSANTPWDSLLSQIELAILNYRKPGIVEFRAPSAERVFRKITQNAKFMVVLVYNEHYTAVTALPLPEIFDNEGRIQLATSTVSSTDTIEDIALNAELLHSQPSIVQDGGVLRHAIVIEQNLGEFRDEKELLIGFWNTWEANRHRFSNQYDSWIREEQARLNHPASGK